MKKIVAAIIVLILLAIVAIRANHNYQAKKAAMNQKTAEKIVPVKIAPPQYQMLDEKIKASGSIQADTDVMVYAKVNGKIASNRVKMGSIVTPGMVLATINRDEVGYQYKPYEVSSEIKGIVSRVMLNPGATVNPNVPMMSIVSVDVVKAVVAVDELKIRFVKLGMECTLTVQAYPDDVFSARVTTISPICNPISRAIDVEVSLANKGYKLKPGMYAEVELTKNSRRVLSLPITAVVERGNQKYVFAVNGTRAHMLPVVTGAVLGDVIEIVTGLSGSEQIVISGADRLEDKDALNIIRD
jgi:multidrug efflux pump subunit AcrA (membrane-fusion protein)